MNLCACGRPTTHKGMCTARWAVRRVNNGSSGIKPKDAEPEVRPIGAVSEEAIARRAFGDLAEDILLLRNRGGHTVARFRDCFRVDREVVTEEGLRAKAMALREKLTTAPAKRRAPEKGIALTKTVIPEILYGDQGGRDAPSVENAREARSAEMPSVPPAVADDLRARIADLEQRVEFLFAVVADAIQGRRETLIEQAQGLAKIETELRSNQ